MKIYTRCGDFGETDLYGGKRVMKDNFRVASFGTVDELNAVIGEILSVGATVEVTRMLVEIQTDLFVLGSDLCTIGAQKHRGKDDVPRMNDLRVTEFEQWIDSLDKSLLPMNAFILPGGCISAAKLHVARTVCRRAERLCTRLFRKEGPDIVSPIIVKYLNRLSDLLFTMARFENAKNEMEEKKWPKEPLKNSL